MKETPTFSPFAFPSKNQEINLQLKKKQEIVRRSPFSKFQERHEFKERKTRLSLFPIPRRIRRNPKLKKEMTSFLLTIP